MTPEQSGVAARLQNLLSLWKKKKEFEMRYKGKKASGASWQSVDVQIENLLCLIDDELEKSDVKSKIVEALEKIQQQHSFEYGNEKGD